MLEQYRTNTAERTLLGVPPLPLTAGQTKELAELLTQGDAERPTLLAMLADRVEPGVSKAAAVKAKWLEQVALGQVVDDGQDGFADQGD